MRRKVAGVVAGVRGMGVRSEEALGLLREYESRNVTHVAADGSWPVVWDRARGVHVWDVEGRKYVDLTAAFGVAAGGHGNVRVMEAGRRQMLRLAHAMGDVHPHELKGRLARELSRVTFERWSRGKRGKVTFSNSGFEAVEAALKTAKLATGRRGVLAFEGGYHGLGYGALEVTHRAYFRGAFESQLGRFGRFVPYPTSHEELRVIGRRIRRAMVGGGIGAVLVEPVQGRGGVRVPPEDFLGLLRGLCDEHGVLLVLDEIYTGFGRTGRMFACEHGGVVPDVICLGKALTGGFPLSACVGEAGVMDAAWPESTGEAMHTSTYLGHPVGCAMALAQIAEIEERGLCERAARLGTWMKLRLERMGEGRLGKGIRVRGLGLMAGVELVGDKRRSGGEMVEAVVRGMLRRGYVVLPEGEGGEVIGLTPPLTIGRGQLGMALDVLEDEVGGVVGL